MAAAFKARGRGAAGFGSRGGCACANLDEAEPRPHASWSPRELVPTRAHPHTSSVFDHCGLMAIRLGRQSGAVPPWLLHMLGLLASLMLAYGTCWKSA